MRPDGRKMTQRDWRNPGARSIGVFLNGDELRMTTPRGEDVQDDSFLLLFNAHSEAVVFTLPTRRFGAWWEIELATAEAPETRLGARALVPVDGHSLMLLRRA